MTRPEPPTEPAAASTSLPNLGLGILSWRGYDSLRATLESYEKSGLLGCFSEKLLFLPEIESQGIALAEEFGIPYQGTDKNLGIMGGFKAMAEAMTSDYVLLAENDFQMSENHDSPHNALSRALKSLKNGESCVWRFRNLKKPGIPINLNKVQKYWPREDATLENKAISFIRRFLRPAKARSFIGMTPYFYEDPEKKFPAVCKRLPSGDLLISSKVCRWTNNNFLINRHFYLDQVITKAEENIGGRLINGFPTIETELNRGSWWKESGFWIGVSTPGLFTHDRLNDRGY